MFVNIEIKLVSTSIDKAKKDLRKKNVVDMNDYKLHWFRCRGELQPGHPLHTDGSDRGIRSS